MNIYVCDDNLTLAKGNLEKIKKLITKHNIDNFEFNYFVFDNAQELLTECTSNYPDAAFLDIEMPGITGFDLSEKLYRINNNVYIFYLTFYNNLAAESIEHRVYRFIRKGDNKDLEKGIISFLNDVRFTTLRYNFSYKDVCYTIAVDEILYLESHRNTLTIHTLGEKIKQNSTIKEALQRLPGKFIQCHKSYIVNLNRAFSIASDFITMDTGEKIPVSKKYRINILNGLK